MFIKACDIERKFQQLICFLFLFKCKNNDEFKYNSMRFLKNKKRF